MIILGYSGFDGVMRFRKECYPDLTEQEYRMCQGLDSSACLLINGRVVAALEQERFNGEKHTCDFPYHAIYSCLEQAGITIQDVNFLLMLQLLITQVVLMMHLCLLLMVLEKCIVFQSTKGNYTKYKN